MLPCNVTIAGEASAAVPFHHGGSAEHVARTVNLALGATMFLAADAISPLIDDHTLFLRLDQSGDLPTHMQ